MGFCELVRPIQRPWKATTYFTVAGDWFLFCWIGLLFLLSDRCDWGVWQSFVFSEIRKITRCGFNSKRLQVENPVSFGSVSNQVSKPSCHLERLQFEIVHAVTGLCQWVLKGKKRLEHLLLNPCNFHTRSAFCNHPILCSTCDVYFAKNKCYLSLPWRAHMFKP